jgi:hypothetical protein
MVKENMVITGKCSCLSEAVFQGGIPDVVDALPKLRVLWAPRATMKSEEGFAGELEFLQEHGDDKFGREYLLCWTILEIELEQVYEVLEFELQQVYEVLEFELEQVYEVLEFELEQVFRFS